MELEQTHARFATTRWTALAELASSQGAGRRAALDALVTRYWPPVYAFLRSLGCPRERAAEQTQAFFVDVVLERRLFERADASRGRLRTLLLTALNRFAIDQDRRRRARGQTLRVPVHLLEQEDREIPIGAAAECGRAFERRWALALLEEALRRCEAHFRASNRTDHWLLFEARVREPAVTGNTPVPFSEIPAASRLGSPASAAAAVQVVKRRAMSLLAEVVGETVGDEDDVTDELARIRSLLQGDG